MNSPTTPDAPAAAHTAPAVSVRELSHCYPPARRGATAAAALDRVSFDIQPGEIFGILGPNGGGKSTLFRILTTLLRPSPPQGQSAGAASVFGHDVATSPQDVRRMLGIVFQHPSLDGKLTAEENCRHQGHLYGLRGGELTDRIHHWLERFGLIDRRHERTERFSGGMRRRVELAKALLHEPKLLLMDEPATGLDPAARRELADQIELLRQQRGMTVALTTHLMDEAERCDRLALISAGKLAAVDTPGRLKAAIGGDVVTVEPAPESNAVLLADHIAHRFGPWAKGAAPQVVADRVRFEHGDGPQIVAAIASAWPGQIRRISVGQPTLEDVFLRLTGHHFADQTDREA